MIEKKLIPDLKITFKIQSKPAKQLVDLECFLLFSAVDAADKHMLLATRDCYL